MQNGFDLFVLLAKAHPLCKRLKEYSGDRYLYPVQIDLALIRINKKERAILKRLAKIDAIMIVGRWYYPTYRNESWYKLWPTFSL